MYLIRLVYASTKSEAFAASDVDNILSTARHHNDRTHVSGLLCFSGEFFLQCLEGSRATVNETYQKIASDPRHHNIVMLSYDEIVERAFGDWGMGYVPTSSLTRDLVMRYSGSPEFHPYVMSGASAVGLLTELGSTVPVLA